MFPNVFRIIRLLPLLCLFFLCFRAQGTAQDFNALLDNSALNFTGTGPAVASPTGGVDGQAFLVGGTNTGISEWRTTVTGPGWMVFWKKFQGSTTASVQLNGVAQETWSSSDYSWTQRLIPVPAGTHEVLWRSNLNAYLGLDRVSFETTLERPMNQIFPDFSWTTGGTQPWTGIIAPSLSLAGALTSALPAVGASGDANWIETRVTGPGRLSWKYQGHLDARMQISAGGIPIPFDWTVYGTRSILLPPGEQVMRWTHQRGLGSPLKSNQVQLLDVAFTPATSLPFSDALLAPGLNFVSGGSAAWHGMSGGAYPAPAAYGTVSWLETIVTGPGVLASTVTPGFTLFGAFRINGVLSTGSGLAIPSRLLGPGTHTIRWEFTHQSSQPRGTTEILPLLNRVNWLPYPEMTFAEALENTGLTFSTSDPANVYGRANTSPDGQEDGVYIGNGGSLKASVTGPGLLSWRRASITPPGVIPTVQLSLDNLPLSDITPANKAAGLQDTLEIPPGIHEVKWSVGASQAFWLQSVSFAPAIILSPTAALGDGATWNYSPEVSFFSTQEGVAAFFLPAPGTESRWYGLNTTVTGPGVFRLRTFNRTLAGTQIQAGLQLFCNDLPRNYSLNIDNWTESLVFIPAGMHSLRLGAPHGTTTTPTLPRMSLISDASWQNHTSVTLNEALDAPSLAFETGGVAAWQGVADSIGDSAQVSQAATSGTAWLETKVPGPGLLSFKFSTRFLTASLSLNGAAGPGVLTGQNRVAISSSGETTVRWQVSLSDLATQWASLDEVSFEPYLGEPLANWQPGTGFSLTGSAHTWSRVASPDLDGGGSAGPASASNSQPVWLEGQFTGPAVLEFFMLRTNASATVSVTRNSAVRSFALSGPSLEWTPVRLVLGEGLQTLRWASNGPFWLDGLKLFPVASVGGDSIEAKASILPAPNGSRTWLRIQDPGFSDGDAIVCEGGFAHHYNQPAIQWSVSGPGLLSFAFKGQTRPSLTKQDNSSVALTWSDAGDGWQRTEVQILPGQHLCRLVPGDNSSLVVDRINFLPASSEQIFGADAVFPLPHGSWSTNPDNPIQGFSTTGSAPAELHGSTIPDGPETWLERVCTGPGFLRFTGSWETPPYNRWTPFPFSLTINGQPVDIGLMVPVLQGTTAQFLVALSPGQHRLRWTLVPPTNPSFSQSVFGTLSAITWTDGSLFAADISGSQAVILSDYPGTGIREQEGRSVLRLPAAPALNPNLYGFEQRRLLWISTGLGLLKFKWIDAPTRLGAPYFGSRFSPVTLNNSNEWPELWFDLGAAPAWKQAAFPSTTPGSHYGLKLSQNDTFDIGDLDFEPWEQIPLAEAMGPLFSNVTTTRPEEWLGIKDRDGKKFPVYFPKGPKTVMNPFQSAYLEATITGPGELGWTQSTLVPHAGPPIEGALNDQWTVGKSLDPIVARETEKIVGQATRYVLYIPPGQRVVRWFGPDYQDRSSGTMSGFTFSPVSQAFHDWLLLAPAIPTARSEASPSLDADMDGMSNLMEFTFGSNYRASNPMPSYNLDRNQGGLLVSVPPHRPATDGVQVVIQTSSDMQIWTDAAVSLASGDPVSGATYRLNGFQPEISQLFVRLAVSMYPAAP